MDDDSVFVVLSLRSFGFVVTEIDSFLVINRFNLLNLKVSDCLFEFWYLLEKLFFLMCEFGFDLCDFVQLLVNVAFLQGINFLNFCF